MMTTDDLERRWQETPIANRVSIAGDCYVIKRSSDKNWRLVPLTDLVEQRISGEGAIAGVE